MKLARSDATKTTAHAISPAGQALERHVSRGLRDHRRSLPHLEHALGFHRPGATACEKCRTSPTRAEALVSTAAPALAAA